MSTDLITRPDLEAIPVGGTISPSRGGRETTMLDPMSRHSIQLLRRAGLTQLAVAGFVGCDERTVRRIEKEPTIDPMAPPESTVGRPSKAKSYIPYVVGQLADEPHLQTGELLRRARLLPVPYAGQKSAFYTMVRKVRKKAADFVTRFEGLAGEFTQHDFGTVIVTFLDGTKRRIKFFASRLKYSRYALVDLVPDETAETLVRTLLDHFERFGGMPMLAVFDRPKTVAVEWRKDGTITKWNQNFASAMVDIGFTAEVCWAYSPNQKGSVENIVGWVKSSFFKQRKFRDLEDLEQQLSEWLEQTNTERPSRATGEVPASRREVELSRLRKPRVSSDELALRRPIEVGRTGVVTFESHDYAVHPDLRGRSATLHIHRDCIRIVAGGREFVYPRRSKDRTVSTTPEVRKAQLELLTQRGKQYCRREHLLHLGASAEAFLTELIHQVPDWDPAVQRLHELLQRHGDDAVERAIRAALAVESIDVAYVARLLGEKEVA